MAAGSGAAPPAPPAGTPFPCLPERASDVPRVLAPRVSDAVRAVTPALVPALASAAALGRLQLAGALLPLTGGGILECHLGRPDRVDLLVCYAAAAGEQAALAAADLLGPAGARIRALAGRLAPAGSRPGAHTEIAWLEFDLDATLAPLPDVFFQAEGADPAAWAELARLLRGAPLAAATVDCLHACRRALPSCGWLRFAGVMLGRNADGLRVTVFGLRPDDVLPYLQAANWPGESGSLSGLLRLARALRPRLVLHLDLGHRVEPALGVEMGSELGVDEAAWWPELLRHFLALTGFPAALQPALLAWPGSSGAADGSGWPAPLHGAYRRIVRWLNHVKWASDGAGSAAAKAYLFYALLPE